MDPSDRASIEVLRPKTVPDNLIALGTISQVSEIQIKLQITGGITCIVDRLNVSDTYTKLIQNYESRRPDSRKSPPGPPKLTQLFNRGQQYICKIIERKIRKGYAEAQDIVATLDPSKLQEDNLPLTVLTIPNMPLQCVVSSVEDHGYHLDIGFKNLVGFLNFDEMKEGRDVKKLLVGQVIRCCTKEAIDETDGPRVIQVSMRKEYFKMAQFSRDKCSVSLLTSKIILPGSVGFCTVMKVLRDGLIVNFLDEFAGFIGMNHLREDGQEPKKKYKIADTLKATVIYYNPTTDTFALSLKLKKIVKLTLRNLLRDHYVGQVIPDAEVAYINGTKYIEFRVGNHKALANVKDAMEQDVNTMTKDELHLSLDSTYPDKSKHKCRIKSINLADLTIILSLRQEFLDLPFVSVEELRPGDFIEATVKKQVKDGLIVSFGLNLRAIILNIHLSDASGTKAHSKAHSKGSNRPERGYQVGKTIKTRVLKVDLHKQPSRVYLTNKAQLMQSDMTIVDSYDKSFRGETINAVICKLKHDGIIVELFNNVKGFIPKRFCSTVPIRTVTDLFQVGQIISCTIYRVEPHRQSMLLGIISYEKIMAMKKENKLARLERRKLKELNKIDDKVERNARKKFPKKIESMKRKLAELDSNNSQNDSEHGSGSNGSDDEEQEDGDQREQKRKKSRLERSIEAKLREERIREAERALLDPDRPAQSIADFERLILKSPNSAEVWIKYSMFFLDNVETEKARIICRRALKTISFRMEKEKIKIWLQLIKIEARYGGKERLDEVIEEAAQVNDKLELFLKAARVLISCDESSKAEKLHEETLKLGRSKPDVWIDYATFLMETKKELDRARHMYDKALKAPLSPNDLVYLRSRFAHLEFKHGDVERGKTLFETLLSENPKRKDIWKVYEAAIRKFGTRQLDTDEVREQNELILQRMATLSK